MFMIFANVIMAFLKYRFMSNRLFFWRRFSLSLNGAKALYSPEQQKNRL